MSSSGLVRLDGGLASIVAGVLLLLGHVLTSSVLAAHILLVFALVALYAAQVERSGSPGVFGMVLSVIGTTLASGADVEAVTGGVCRARSPCWEVWRLLSA